MNTPPKLPDILIGKPRLPQSRFHREAMASYHGISYADVFTQYGKLLEGVEIVGFSDAGSASGCFESCFSSKMDNMSSFIISIVTGVSSKKFKIWELMLKNTSAARIGSNPVMEINWNNHM